MLLSKQQQYVLDVLRRLGCARETQLQALLQARFFPPDKAVPPGLLEAMLRQLRAGMEGSAALKDENWRAL